MDVPLWILQITRMAVGGRKLPFLLVGVLWMASLTVCFNLEPRTGLVYAYPYARTEGRESYFGFSVAVQHNEASDKNLLLVGAPRANSSIYNEKQITEPGAVFKCDLSGATCAELHVDTSGNKKFSNQTPDFRYQDLKNYGWLGESMDSQPHLHDGRQFSGMCAPRWRNQLYHPQHYMNGVCYLVDDSDPSATHDYHKELPLVNRREQTKEVVDKHYHHYAYGQAGMSVHFPGDQTNFIIGAPGVFNWHGTVILYKELDWKKRVFTQELVPYPLYFSLVRDGDLFGYAVTSGRFLSQNKILYAGGAPRGADSYGKVIVFDFPLFEDSDLLTRRELKGNQLGEYFGAALTAADINGDGLSDLIVGSPMYSLSNLPDVGRVQTFLSSKGLGLRIRPEPHYGKEVNLARFGTSLASPGDLNADGYEGE